MTMILVIEDQESIRENILELLSAENFDAIAVENGRQGIKMAKEKMPDLIICDVMMPEIDGYGVLKELRSEPATAIIPFIFLTALSDVSDTRKGMELGADDYLTKPCTPQELLKAISTRLEKQAIINQTQSQKLDDLRNSITFSLPHELRTPLNGIIATSDFLLGELDDLEIAEIREMIQQIQSSGKRLYRLIQNFLLYIELELIAKDPEKMNALNTHSVGYPEAIITEQANYQAQKAEREADLHLELENANVKISHNRLQKVVEELLDNAFKFSSPGTPVHITAKVENDAYILAVSDKGRGMNAQQIANLGAYMQFERKFYEQQGSGLGLAIIKRMTELYGGKLNIESIPGQQTTVQVILPILPVCH